MCLGIVIKRKVEHTSYESGAHHVHSISNDVNVNYLQTEANIAHIILCLLIPTPTPNTMSSVDSTSSRDNDTASMLSSNSSIGGKSWSSKKRLSGIRKLKDKIKSRQKSSIKNIEVGAGEGDDNVSCIDEMGDLQDVHRVEGEGENGFGSLLDDTEIGDTQRALLETSVDDADDIICTVGGNKSDGPCLEFLSNVEEDPDSLNGGETAIVDRSGYKQNSKMNEVDEFAPVKSAQEDDDIDNSTSKDEGGECGLQSPHESITDSSAQIQHHPENNESNSATEVAANGKEESSLAVNPINNDADTNSIREEEQISAYPSNSNLPPRRPMLMPPKIVISLTSHQSTPSAVGQLKSFTETSAPATVSAVDSMAQFSTIRGPSPKKLKSPHSKDIFDFDMSMDTSDGAESTGSGGNDAKDECVRDFDDCSENLVMDAIDNNEDATDGFNVDENEIATAGEKTSEHTPTNVGGEQKEEDDDVDDNLCGGWKNVAEESNTEESGNEVGENDESFAETNEANEEITINGWKSVNLIERDVFTGKHVSFKEGVLSQLNTPRSTFQTDKSTPSPSNHKLETPPPTTVSAADSMARFSSISGPSPVKLNGPSVKCFGFDVSMDTTLDEGLAQSDTLGGEESDGSDVDMIVWSGLCDGVTIAIGEDEDTVAGGSSADERSLKEDPSPRKRRGSRFRRSPRKSLRPHDEGAKHTKVYHPSTVLSSRMANQISNMPTTTSLLHQEYNVDHSCSTPLERLARDIGNTFRQWNVHQGCDRHVSLDWKEKIDALEDEIGVNDSVEDTTRSERQIDAYMNAERLNLAIASDLELDNDRVMSMDICMNRFANRSRKINEWRGDDNAKPSERVDTTERKFGPPAALQEPQPQSPPELQQVKQRRAASKHSNRGAQCIRSKKISFQTIGYSPQNDGTPSSRGGSQSMAWNRRRYTIPLVLSLWDAPIIATSVEAAERTSKDEASGSIERKKQSIPLSLQSDPSHSSYSLLGEYGLLSSCGNSRSLYSITDSSAHASTPGSASDNTVKSQAPSRNVAFDHSLRPLESGLAQDISSLFNIGQHITLSLDVSSVQSSSRYQQQSRPQQDIQSLYDDIHAYITSVFKEAIEEKHLAQRGRRHRMKQLLKRQLRREQKVQQLQSRHCANGDIVEVGSQSKPYELDGEEGGEELTFYDTEDKENEIYSVNYESEMTHDIEEDGQYDDNDESDSMDGTLSLDEELELRQHEIHAEVAASLSSILQAALNFAASENDCCIPVFGLWSIYCGASRVNDKIENRGDLFGGGICAAPSWIPSSYRADGSISGSGWNDVNDEASFQKILLSSPSLVGTCQSGVFRSIHRVYSITHHPLPMHLSTLHGLACVLLSQCPSQIDGRVMVTAARHCYHWEHDNEKNARRGEDQDWRMLCFITDDESTSAVEVYRQKCRRQALLLLERASSPWEYRSLPIWGPSEGSPLLSLSASVSWGVVPLEHSTGDVTTHNDVPYENNVPPPPHLLQLPLKIRSSKFVPSPNELLDMEYALQSAAFDPLGLGVKESDGSIEFGPREPIFFASAKLDANAPCATLSANTRCVLAAVLRCGSLGLDVLPGHLTKKEVLSSLGKKKSETLDVGDDVNEAISESERVIREALKHVGPVTARLVDAMDWADLEKSAQLSDLDRGISEGEFEERYEPLRGSCSSSDTLLFYLV